MSEPETQTGPIGLLEELDEPGPLVGILVGSESDLEAMDPALAELRERGISHELKVLSAHRNPRGVAEYSSTLVVGIQRPSVVSFVPLIERLGYVP